jgi:predicted DsbA family dithiol-disulfide isomerase
MHDRLMDAYWSEAQDVGDPDVLRSLSAEVGLDEAEVDAVLAGDRYRDLVASSTAQAHSIGINAIPAFLLDRRLVILGAQPREAFEQAFQRLAS